MDSIQDGKFGVCVKDVFDETEWYDKLMFLINNPAKTKEIAKQGQKVVRHEYDIKKCMQDLRTILEKLVVENKSK